MTTATRPDNPLTQFAWTPQPEAERLVGELVAELLRRLPQARALAETMRTNAGVRFQDFIDHFELVGRSGIAQRLCAAGYVEDPERSFELGAVPIRVFVQKWGIFPPILLRESEKCAGHLCAAIKVESVADFAAVHSIEIHYSHSVPPYRSMHVATNYADATLEVVERHGIADFHLRELPSAEVRLGVLLHLERFRTRRRTGDGDLLKWGDAIVAMAIAKIGRDWTCDLFFAAEREYWMRRNRAAQVQYARQQRLGLGWANHDHHTYRSSRQHFARLIAIWEKLGFVCRERFYAGAEAGWGAQVMEHPVCGIVTFNDVDLSPDELMTDFAHEPLPPRRELGTVGLWCALHGESFLEAGMHHLECTFDFDALKRQLESEHAIKVMKPFTDLPHLKQAFTEGERWPVRPERIERLLADGRITPGQAEKFRTEGAIGSHLENLERNAGFKGFNQKGVSEIIAATDPRRQ